MILSAALTALALLIGLAVHEQTHDRELEIYRVLMTSSAFPARTNVIYRSRATDCKPNPQNDVSGRGKELRNANSNSSPKNLASLRDIASVISHKDAKDLNGQMFIYEPDDQQVVTLSRVAFLNSNNEALVCAYSRSAALLFLLQNSDGWKIVDSQLIWTI